MKHVKLFENFIGDLDYEQNETVYETERETRTDTPAYLYKNERDIKPETDTALGMVVFESENYPEKPFRCLIWIENDNAYREYGGFSTEKDAIDRVNLEVDMHYGVG